MRPNIEELIEYNGLKFGVVQEPMLGQISCIVASSFISNLPLKFYWLLTTIFLSCSSSFLILKLSEDA